MITPSPELQRAGAQADTYPSTFLSASSLPLFYRPAHEAADECASGHPSEGAHHRSNRAGGTTGNHFAAEQGYAYHCPSYQATDAADHATNRSARARRTSSSLDF